MHSPAAALGWEILARHRSGLTVLALYFAALAGIRLLADDLAGQLDFKEAWKFGLLVMVPLASTVTYVLAIFSFGLGGDLAARRSPYPARLFILPVTNSALVAWPMLLGAATMAALWLVTRLLALWPPGAEVPTVWPGCFAVVLLAWTQALTWLPYPLRGARVIITVVWLALIGFTVLLALHLHTRETILVALLVPQLPVAFLAARFGVARARRGDIPRWRLGRLQSWRHRRSPSRRWTSPSRAQSWLEWRRHGHSLPALVALVLPFELLLLVVFRSTPSLVLSTLVATLLTPPFLAAFAAASVRRSEPAADAYRLTPFVTTRPLTSAALVGAKLSATARSTLVAWGLLAAAVPVTLAVSGGWLAVADAGRRLADAYGTPRVTVLGLLALVALVILTWKQLVQGLFLGLSGRPWLVKANVFFTLTVLAVMVPLVPWVLDHQRVVVAKVWNALPWLLVLLVAAKLIAAAWVAARLHRHRLLSGRQLVLGAFAWDLAVLTLFWVLAWLLPSVLFHRPLILLLAILAVPLVRISGSPLALSWNRHR